MGAYFPALNPDALAELERRKQLAQMPSAMPTNQTAPSPIPQQGMPPPPPPPPAGDAPAIPQAPPPQYSPDGLSGINRIPSEIAPYAMEPRDPAPAYTALQKFQAENQRPLQGDYHPSVGRRIAAGIFGGFAGLGGAKQGMETADAVLNGPYHQKVNDYESKLAQKKEQFKEENESRKLEADIGDKGSQSVQRKALAAEADRKGTPAWVRTNAQAAHIPTPVPVRITLANNETVDGTRTISPDGVTAIKTSDGTLLGPKAYTAVKLHDDADPKTLDTAWLGAFKAEHHREPTTAEIETAQHARAERLQTDDKGTYYRNNAAINQGRQIAEGNKNAGNAPDVVASDLAAQKQNSQYLYSIKDPTQVGLVKKAMGEAGMPIPRQLTSKQLDHRDIANRSMAAADNLEKLTKDPDIANNIGSIMGQWDASSRHFLGQTPNLPPEVQKKVQMYRTALEQLFSNEVQAVTNASAREGLQRANKEMKGTPRDILPNIQGIIAQTRAYAKDSLRELRKAEGLPDDADSGDIQDQVNRALQQFMQGKQKKVVR